jgi:hypothetical protein
MKKTFTYKNTFYLRFIPGLMLMGIILMLILYSHSSQKQKIIGLVGMGLVFTGMIHNMLYILKKPKSLELSEGKIKFTFRNNTYKEYAYSEIEYIRERVELIRSDIKGVLIKIKSGEEFMIYKGIQNYDSLSNYLKDNFTWKEKNIFAHIPKYKDGTDVYGDN